MTLVQQIAKHLRDVHFGGNWTASNLKKILSDVNWQEATTKVDEFINGSEITGVVLNKN